MRADQREDIRTAYREKNLRRRAGRREVGSRAYMEARFWRQVCKGKFGWLKPSDWNRLIIGTTGAYRLED